MVVTAYGHGTLGAEGERMGLGLPRTGHQGKGLHDFCLWEEGVRNALLPNF